MPTVSGSIYYDPARNANSAVGVTGLADIPVVLQDTATLVRQIVLTAANGIYSFINVPAGNYRIVEAFGQASGVPSPADFSTAAFGTVPLAVLPPISVIPTPANQPGLHDTQHDSDCRCGGGRDGVKRVQRPRGLSAADAGARPLLHRVSRQSGDRGGQRNLWDVFHRYADEHRHADEPLSGDFPDFTYVVPDSSKYTPIDGEFTIQNTMNDAMSNVIGAWWRISDRSTGNETGRMMIANEDNPGSIIFRTTVAVVPNQTYLFST